MSSDRADIILCDVSPLGGSTSQLLGELGRHQESVSLTSSSAVPPPPAAFSGTTIIIIVMAEDAR